MLIDNEEAGQQIKCQVWLAAWYLIIYSQLITNIC